MGTKWSLTRLDFTRITSHKQNTPQRTQRLQVAVIQTFRNIAFILLNAVMETRLFSLSSCSSSLLPPDIWPGRDQSGSRHRRQLMRLLCSCSLLIVPPRSARTPSAPRATVNGINGTVRDYSRFCRQCEYDVCSSSKGQQPPTPSHHHHHHGLPQPLCHHTPIDGPKKAPIVSLQSLE